MGGCFSKKKASSAHHSQPQVAAPPVPVPSASLAAETSLTSHAHHTLKVGSGRKIYKVAEEEEQDGKERQEEEGLVKKEIFVIKHRKSHDSDRRSPPPNAPHSAAENESASGEGVICNISTAVRTSSCTKEDVDAILIQCGRLSRSNSAGKTTSSSRKYSGTKRSYDFDNENDNNHYHIGVASADNGSRKKGNDGFCDDDHDRPRHRQSSRSSSSSHGRRRTPSREREQHLQRSGSRERGGNSSSGGRRVSRSPGRRSENPNTQALGSNANAANATSTNRPGKMVSVPATVSSLLVDTSSNGNGAGGIEANGIKRISVKRNAVGAGVDEATATVVGSRSAASPRSQSPARTRTNPNVNANNAKGCNENQQQPTLSRSSSRKAEHSPYTRNPLSEIDSNSLGFPQSAANKTSCGINKQGQGGVSKDSTNKTNVEMYNKVIVQGSNYKAGSIDNKVVNVNTTAKEQRMVEEAKSQPPMTGTENLKPQTLTRSRSSRRSRDLDLDLNPETLNPVTVPPSYTTLLLEDIQNFHQTNNPPSTSFSLPPCVSKAFSILEAVADLNSTTSSNLSSACEFSEDRKGLSRDESSKNGYNVSVGRNMVETRDPFVESEVVGADDLIEPSFHKYVTVRRGVTDIEEEEQESSGSNSFVGSGQQQRGISSSSREPNSAESTDRWTSRTKSKDENHRATLGGLQRQAFGDSAEQGTNIKNSTRKGLNGRRGDSYHQHAGIEQAGKMGAGEGLYSVAFAAPST